MEMLAAHFGLDPQGQCSIAMQAYVIFLYHSLNFTADDDTGRVIAKFGLEDQ